MRPPSLHSMDRLWGLAQTLVALYVAQHCAPASLALSHRRTVCRTPDSRHFSLKGIPVKSHQWVLWLRARDISRCSARPSSTATAGKVMCHDTVWSCLSQYTVVALSPYATFWVIKLVNWSLELFSQDIILSGCFDRP